MPEAPGWKLVLPQASMATPTKPITSPSVREAPGRSPSQSQATTAPNSGTVALRMDVSPVLMDSSAKLNSANGRAELVMPQNSTGFQCWRS